MLTSRAASRPFDRSPDSRMSMSPRRVLRRSRRHTGGLDAGQSLPYVADVDGDHRGGCRPGPPSQSWATPRCERSTGARRRRSYSPEPHRDRRRRRSGVARVARGGCRPRSPRARPADSFHSARGRIGKEYLVRVLIVVPADPYSGPFLGLRPKRLEVDAVGDHPTVAAECCAHLLRT